MGENELPADLMRYRAERSYAKDGAMLMLLLIPKLNPHLGDLWMEQGSKDTLAVKRDLRCGMAHAESCPEVESLVELSW
ncbi:hypothetical protein KQX54_021200 [Cotesia glomerata]|uniref:Uncharacterized protein n=1 Tax=Cotesia glomerata TaxID=32391 RepID=A0AAV7J8Q8_COTGL|nr:hypothetical protein KQX54_021200 [Cotesia glomerata]